MGRLPSPGRRVARAGCPGQPQRQGPDGRLSLPAGTHGAAHRAGGGVWRGGARRGTRGPGRPGPAGLRTAPGGERPHQPGNAASGPVQPDRTFRTDPSDRRVRRRIGGDRVAVSGVRHPPAGAAGRLGAAGPLPPAHHPWRASRGAGGRRRERGRGIRAAGIPRDACPGPAGQPRSRARGRGRQEDGFPVPAGAARLRVDQAEAATAPGGRGHRGPGGQGRPVGRDRLPAGGRPGRGGRAAVRRAGGHRFLGDPAGGDRIPAAATVPQDPARAGRARRGPVRRLVGHPVPGGRGVPGRPDPFRPRSTGLVAGLA